MGIKENFTQAVKELTGGGKSQPETQDKNKTSKVDDLRRAIETETAEKSVVPAAESKISAPPIQVTPAELPSVLAQIPPASQGTQTEQAVPTGFDTEAQDATPPPVPPLFSVPQGESGTAGNSAEPNISGLGGLGMTEPGIVPAFNASLGNGDDGLGDELTVISKNTVIEGNIRSFANMNVDGNVRGDIETTKNIELNGKIVGNLTCNNAQMLTSQIQGNIRMKGNITMGRDTLLIGDLVSTYAMVNGKIKGNLEVGGKAELKGDSVIFGDISASTITVDDGAIIQGYVSTTFLNKEESRNIFPESISIAE
ncbi:MAG: polymer-forming cytoskeletal protein [Oscillospiraceae bacterium]|nr:polymer-forming cytoskeletal protein [Oscillospiraceae bacterium]